MDRAELRDEGLWKAVSKSRNWAAVIAKIITEKGLVGSESVSHMNIGEREFEAELVCLPPLLFEENPNCKCGCDRVRQGKKEKMTSEKSGKGQNTAGYDQ